MKVSLSGRFFYRLDRICNNFKKFLRRHYHTIDFLFLFFYITLQLFLIIFIYLFKIRSDFIISIFIILFLFIISSERIILQFKSKQAQEGKSDVEKQYYELKSENKILRVKNKELIERVKFIFGFIRKRNN